MTPDLAALVARAQELDAKATAGPWHADIDGRDDGAHQVVYESNPERWLTMCFIATGRDDDSTVADAEFIAEARTLLPQLAAALASQGEEIARLRELVQAERDRAQWIISFAAEHGRAGLSWSMGLDKHNQPNVSAPPPPDQGGA